MLTMIKAKNDFTQMRCNALTAKAEGREGTPEIFANFSVLGDLAVKSLEIRIFLNAISLDRIFATLFQKIISCLEKRLSG
jgi:hypothetical protein